MGNLLFSPNGRINPSQFMKGVVIVLIASFVLGLPTALGMSGAIPLIASLISVVLLWCWIVLWIKRYHDAGKSGWMSLIPILVFVIAMIVFVLTYGGAELSAIFQLASEGASAEEQEAVSKAFEAKLDSFPALIILTIMSAVIAFLFNAIIKRDDHENQFGPAS